MYLSNFFCAACSATAPDSLAAASTYDSASADATVTSQAKGFSFCHGIKDRPSGLLPSRVQRPASSLEAGIPAELNARQMMSQCHSWSITIPYGMEKLAWSGYPTVKNFDDMFSHLDRIPACDGQTDGQRDILQRHSPRYVCASHGKNCCSKFTVKLTIMLQMWGSTLEFWEPWEARTSFSRTQGLYSV